MPLEARRWECGDRSNPPPPTSPNYRQHPSDIGDAYQFVPFLVPMRLKFEFQGIVDEDLFKLRGSNLVALEMVSIVVVPVKA